MTSIMYNPNDPSHQVSRKGGTNPLLRKRPTMVQPPTSPLTNPIPTAPQAPQGTFGPGNDLRSRQIDPTPSARLTGAQGMTNTAAQGVQNFNRGAAVSSYGQQFGAQLGVKPVGMRQVNPRVNAGSVNTQVGFKGVNPNVGYQAARTSAQFQGVNPNVQARNVNTQVQARSVYGNGMPSRTDLAKRALSDFTEQSALDRNQGIRQIGQSAAKFGRIGAGMTTNDLTGLEANLDRNRRVQETDLARSVAEGDISDRFRDRDYLTGVDTDNVGRAMQDRDYLTGVDERNYGRATNERDSALALDERNIAREAQERDFSTGLSERNYGRATNERDTEMGLGERNVGRAMDDRAFTTGLEERNVGRDYGMAQDQAGLDERNTGRDFDARRTALEMSMGMADRESGDAMDRFNTASGYERGIYGQEAADRDELRGERGYQEEMNRYAGDQRIRQREMENRERDAEFQRAAERARLGMAGSQQVGAGAEGANDLLMDWMQRRTAAGGAPQSGGSAPAPWSRPPLQTPTWQNPTFTPQIAGNTPRGPLTTPQPDIRTGTRFDPKRRTPGRIK